MVSRIEQLISEIETYIDNCKPQAFNNKKITVDKDEIEDLLVELRHRTPEEIKKYQKIISNQEAIINDAKVQADAMVREAKMQADAYLTDARRQTNELVNEHEIMQKAYAKANEIVEKASAQAEQILASAAGDANNIREGSLRYSDGMLKTLQTIISHTMETANSKHLSMMNSLQSNYDIITSNRKELSGEDLGIEESEEGKEE